MKAKIITIGVCIVMLMGCATMTQEIAEDADTVIVDMQASIKIGLKFWNKHSGFIRGLIGDDLEIHMTVPAYERLQKAVAFLDAVSQDDNPLTDDLGKAVRAFRVVFESPLRVALERFAPQILASVARFL